MARPAMGQVAPRSMLPLLLALVTAPTTIMGGPEPVTPAFGTACWAGADVRGTNVVAPVTGVTETACRVLCQDNNDCAYFAFFAGTCALRKDLYEGEDGTPRPVKGATTCFVRPNRGDYLCGARGVGVSTLLAVDSNKDVQGELDACNAWCESVPTCAAVVSGYNGNECISVKLMDGSEFDASRTGPKVVSCFKTTFVPPTMFE